MISSAALNQNGRGGCFRLLMSLPGHGSTGIHSLQNNRPPTLPPQVAKPLKQWESGDNKDTAFHPKSPQAACTTELN